MGDTGGTLRLYNELLPERLHIFGPCHPATLMTRRDIAYWTGVTGDVSKALKLYRALLPDLHRGLGSSHSETLATQKSVLWLESACSTREQVTE